MGKGLGLISTGNLGAVYIIQARLTRGLNFTSGTFVSPVNLAGVGTPDPPLASKQNMEVGHE